MLLLLPPWFDGFSGCSGTPGGPREQERCRCQSHATFLLVVMVDIAAAAMIVVVIVVGEAVAAVR